MYWVINFHKPFYNSDGMKKKTDNTICKQRNITQTDIPTKNSIKKGKTKNIGTTWK